MAEAGRLYHASWIIDDRPWCTAQWSSADADAFVRDRLNGLVADPAKVRPINHVGRFFKVKVNRGPIQ